VSLRDFPISKIFISDDFINIAVYHKIYNEILREIFKITR